MVKIPSSDLAHPFQVFRGLAVRLSMSRCVETQAIFFCFVTWDLTSMSFSICSIYTICPSQATGMHLDKLLLAKIERI